jgi:hypothetical protein
VEDEIVASAKGAAPNAKVTVGNTEVAEESVGTDAAVKRSPFIW